MTEFRYKSRITFPHKHAMLWVLLQIYSVQGLRLYSLCTERIEEEKTIYLQTLILNLRRTWIEQKKMIKTTIGMVEKIKKKLFLCMVCCTNYKIIEILTMRYCLYIMCIASELKLYQCLKTAKYVSVCIRLMSKKSGKKTCLDYFRLLLFIYSLQIA